MSSKAARTQIV